MLTRFEQTRVENTLMTQNDTAVISPSFARSQSLRAVNNRQLLASLRYNSLQNALVSGIFVIFFAQQGGSPQLWKWWTGFALVVAARAGVLRWLEVTEGVDESVRSAAIYGCIGATALAWGVAPLACVAADAELSFILAVSWVTIVVSGGANAFQEDSVATTALVVPATVPALVVLISNHDRTSYAVVAALGLIYAHMAISNMRARHTRTIEQQLKDENTKLMAEYKSQARLASAEIERRLHIERELRAARHRAERLSSLDGLTGIANRRYFDEKLKAELARTFRAQKPLALVLLDVDCFKQYNDTLGHGAGDDCLAKIGKILAGYARRSGDLAARYGGEEFVLLLPESDLAAAVSIAERVRMSIVDRAIPHAKSEVANYITASFGVASFTPNADHTARQLIEAADQALYQAKKTGRNRVVSAA